MANKVTLGPEYIPNPTIGRPIANGFMYVGEIDKDPTDEDNQKQVSVLQESGTIVEIPQPVNLSGGGIPEYNGSPVTVLVDGPYSLLVQDKQGSQVYYVPFNAETTDDYLTFETISDLRDNPGLFQNQTAQVLGYYTVGDGGCGPTRYWSEGQLPGTYVDNGGSIIVPTGGDGSAAWLWGYVGKINVKWYGIYNDNTNGDTNTAIYQKIIDQAQNGNFREIYFPDGDYAFGPIAGRTTCIFLSSDTNDFQAKPNPITISGTGRILIPNSGANYIWMSGPPNDEPGVTNVNAVNISGLKFISKSIVDNPLERTTYDDPNTTMPNYGIAFNISKWFRSEFCGNSFEFCQGFIQDPTLADSSGTYIQQITIDKNISTHHQNSFLEAQQAYSCEITRNIIERGNGGLDLQRSSAQTSYQLTISGNTIQANGVETPLRLNYGYSLVITNNYFESNRKATATAVEHIDMSSNAIDTNSIVFEGNFFSQSAGNLDGYGADYYAVILDGFDTFRPKGNSFLGGNGYLLTNSAGTTVYSIDEKFDSVGSIYNEGIIANGTGVNSSKADYFKGTWVPVIADAPTGGNIATATIQNSLVVKNGDIVTVCAQILNIDTTGLTAGNALYIRNFPYKMATDSVSNGAVVLEQIVFSGMVSVKLTTGQDYAVLRQSVSGGNDTSLLVSAFNTGLADIDFQITYVGII